MRCFHNCSAAGGVRKATRREQEALRSGLSRIELLVGIGVVIGGCLSGRTCSRPSFPSAVEVIRTGLSD